MLDLGSLHLPCNQCLLCVVLARVFSLSDINLSLSLKLGR